MLDFQFSLYLCLMSPQPLIEVCLSPALLHLHETKNKIVVIIDVFRASSTIIAALDNGAARVIPTSSVPECIELSKTIHDSITAGERDGKVAEGLEYGNSPIEYDKDFISGKSLLLTTTNGTRLLHMVEDSEVIVIGAFLNLNAICSYLREKQKDVILACAAWKDKINLEDSLFAGAVLEQVQDSFEIYDDSGRMCLSLYLQAKAQGSIIDFLRNSTHYHRLSGYGLVDDMVYASQIDTHPVVPYFNGKEIVI